VVSHSNSWLVVILIDSPMALDISCMDTDDSVRPVVDAATSSVDRETSLYCLPEYRDDIIEYLKEAETRCRPKVVQYIHAYCIAIPLTLRARAHTHTHTLCSFYSLDLKVSYMRDENHPGRLVGRGV